MKRTLVWMLIGLLSCISLAQAQDDSWTRLKDNTRLEIASAAYGVPLRHPMATMGWEDGIHITRDGLRLYTTYAPGDLFSWLVNSSDPTAFSPYLRGADYGMDLVSNPVGAAAWIHSDILMATRASMDEPFGDWQRTSFSQAVFSEGGAIMQEATQTNTAYQLVYTFNNKPPDFDLDIWQITLDEQTHEATSTATPLANFPHSAYNEDNPHWEQVDENTILVFFDSDNYPDGLGDNDIWMSQSDDNGATWSDVQAVTSINTPEKEHQPHLFQTAEGEWYLYFSAAHSDGKLAIFRSKQLEKDNWLLWGERELLIGAGNSAGVGEPTLTADGGISFVVVYENPDGTEFDRYDADPWYLPIKKE